MIELAHALNRIASLPDNAVCAAVIDAIFDGRVLGGLGIREEQPEDVFVPLLVEIHNGRRSAVMAGCREVFARFSEILSSPVVPASDELADAAAHFSTLLGQVRAKEFTRHVRSLLELALDPSIAEAIREPFVGLAVDYAPIDPRPEYWQDLLVGNLIPGYAFQALLHIDPHHARLEGYLVNLWQRALRGEIALRIPFVVEQWARKQPAIEAAVRRILRELVSDTPELRQAVDQDMSRYPHSSPWRDLLPAKSVPKRAPFKLLHTETMPSQIAGWESSQEAQIVQYPFSSKVLWKSESISQGEAERSVALIELDNMNLMQGKNSKAGRSGRSPHILFVREQANPDAAKFVEETLERFAANLSNQLNLYYPLKCPASIG